MVLTELGLKLFMCLAAVAAIWALFYIWTGDDAE